MSVLGRDLIKPIYYNPISEFEKIQINKYGSRYEEYRKSYEQALKLEYLSEYPLYIMLEQIYRCNLSCPGCIHGYKNVSKEYSFKEKVMPMSLFNNILKESRENDLPSISMMVNDEPLLIKNIGERIRLAREAGIMDIILVTNGTLLTMEKARDIISAGVTHILISIDAATKETYSLVRPGGCLDDVLKGIEYINEIRKAKMFPILRVSFMKTRLNEREEELFLDYFRDKVDYVDIQNFGGFRDINLDLKPEGAMYGMDIACMMPWTRLSIRANGDVMPCCAFYGYDTVVGNVYNNSIKDIWHSKIMNKLRSDAKKMNYTVKACSECMSRFVATC